MHLKYGCPYWGSDHYTPKEFISKVVEAGYDGVELFLQPPDELTNDFLKEIAFIKMQRPDFFFIALQLIFPAKESVDEHISKMEKNLQSLAALNPLFINSHTGKDYYSFDENCRVIEAAMNFSIKSGIRILHETHRGRFSFHAASLLPYLKMFPEMELVGDLSHFCTVSESMLDDQQEILQQIIPHVSHIHARVGFEQGPQVNNPAAPEWQSHLNQFMIWWQKIIQHKKSQQKEVFTISPEFGPAPYLPLEPFTQKPLSNQWENNYFMLNKLKERFS